MLVFWYFMGSIQVEKDLKCLIPSYSVKSAIMWNISTLVCPARKKKNLTVLMRNELLNKSSPFANTGWTLWTTDIFLWWSVLTSSLPSFLWQFPSAWMEKGMGSGTDKKTPTLILPSFSKVFSLIKKGWAVLVCNKHLPNKMQQRQRPRRMSCAAVQVLH